MRLHSRSRLDNYIDFLATFAKGKQHTDEPPWLQTNRLSERGHARVVDDMAPRSCSATRLWACGLVALAMAASAAGAVCAEYPGEDDDVFVSSVLRPSPSGLVSCMYAVFTPSVSCAGKCEVDGRSRCMVRGTGKRGTVGGSLYRQPVFGGAGDCSDRWWNPVDKKVYTADFCKKENECKCHGGSKCLLRGNSRTVKRCQLVGEGVGCMDMWEDPSDNNTKYTADPCRHRTFSRAGFFASPPLLAPWPDNWPPLLVACAAICHATFPLSLHQPPVF